MRTILLTLQALRAVERYGAVRDHAQYRGFKALPASTTLTMGRAAAIRILAEHSGINIATNAEAELLRRAYLVARGRTHPDRVGHDRDWHLVEAAARELRIAERGR